jgi:hypothetical protein
MARRRAKAAQAHARVVPEELPVSARVAWSYLAAVLAVLVAAGFVLVTNQTLAVISCRDTADGAIADCKFGWAIWSGLAGFLLGLVPIARKLKLDWWLIASMWAGVGIWVAADAIGQWWWWLLALALPAITALISANWHRGGQLRRWQLGLLIALGVAAVADLVWWYLNG